MTQIPLYFLPGTQCDQQLWQGVFELLPSRFNPTAIVLPQEKSPLEIVHTLHQQLSSIQQPEQSLNLIGFSLGGYLASLYATCYPEQLNKLLIIANAPFSLPTSELKIRNQTLTYIKSHGYKGMPIKRITQLLANSNKDNINIINTITDMDKRCGQVMLKQQLANTSERLNLIPQLINMPFDIQFIIGSEDKLVNVGKLKQELAKSVEEIITRDISLDLIDDCGHMIPLENPQAVADHIISFFS